MTDTLNTATHPHRRRLVRTTAAATALAVAGLWTAGQASAHVTVQSPGATQGGYSVLTFRVPTESAAASTTALRVQLPSDHPIASISVQPHTGWTYKVTKATLATPIKTDDGELTEAVSEISWTAASADTAIKPGEFDQFNVSAGPLPTVAALTFKAIQTYSDGTQVSWTDVAAAGSTTELAHPAPTLKLAAAAGSPSAAGNTTGSATGNSATSDSATSNKAASQGTATTGIVLGIVGVLLGAGALAVALRGQRSRADAAGPTI